MKTNRALIGSENEEQGGKFNKNSSISNTMQMKGVPTWARICLVLLFVTYLILLALTFTFGPRSPGSSSSTLNSSFSAPLRKCLLSLWIAPLVRRQKMRMFVFVVRAN